MKNDGVQESTVEYAYAIWCRCCCKQIGKENVKIEISITLNGDQDSRREESYLCIDCAEAYGVFGIGSKHKYERKLGDPDLEFLIIDLHDLQWNQD